jgi:two-component system chemotaxis response regulator CheY
MRVGVAPGYRKPPYNYGRARHFGGKQFGPELTRCSMTPDTCHGADGCRFGKEHRDDFVCHAHPPMFGGLLSARSKDMAFDLSMPILVVDDYSTMIRIIRNLLKQLGFENVDDASDGSAALAKMQGKRYGLVISDWNMEPMTGYDLLKEVRASPEFSNTPFIMITAESKTENVIAAKKAGVSNYIVKPFNAATLKTKMEAVFPSAAE